MPEAYRVGLGHVRALYQYTVGVLQVHQAGGGAAPTVRDAQTGHRSTVSYSCLVRYSYEPHRVEELGDEVVLLVVYRRAPDGGDGHRAAYLHALLVGVFPVLVARLLEPVGDHVHRLVERQLLPLLGVGPAVLDLRPAVRRVHHPVDSRALGTQGTGVDGAIRVALYVYDAAVAVVDQGRAANRAVRADATRLLHAGVVYAGPQFAGRRADRVLHLHADVVLDLRPQPVRVGQLEEHAPLLPFMQPLIPIYSSPPLILNASPSMRNCFRSQESHFPTRVTANRRPGSLRQLEMGRCCARFGH